MTAGLMLSVLLAAAPADSAAFVASSPAGERPVGRLVKLLPDGTAELAGNEAVAVRDLVSLRRSALPLPPLPRGPALVTTTGDRIPGRVLGGDEQALKFRPGFLDQAAPDWSVPLSSAAVVWFSTPPADTPADPSRDPWMAENRKRDIVRFRNGDLVPGSLDGFAAEPPAVRFKPEAGVLRTVPLTEVAALAFNLSLARGRKPKGSYAHLVLRDGTRLDITDPLADADTLHGKTLFGQAVQIPVTELIALDIYQGKAVYLSDLKPKKIEQSGFLGTPWPPANDRTVRATPLRLLTPLGEQTFDKGLGTHPRTTLTYDLAGKYRRFEALVGLDAETGARGTAAVRVLVDGKEQPLPALQKLTAGLAVPVPVEVLGAKELAVVIDFGPAGDVQADVNWADARLVE